MKATTKRRTAAAGRLAGKVALVTGAGGAIGGAIARLFAAEGAAVVCADIDRATARRTARAIAAEGGAAIAFAGDVSDSIAAKAAAATAVRRFGALHVLVNNAAFFVPDATLPELDEALFARSFAVNAPAPS